MPEHHNPKREMFCREFLVDLNAAAAARRAGYSERTATYQGYQMMKDPEVQKRVQELIEARNEQVGITASMVIAEIAKVGFASMRRFIAVDGDGQPKISLTDTPINDLDALSEVQTETVIEADGEDMQRVRKTRIKLHDKLGALRLLGQHTGAFKEPEREVADALTSLVKAINKRGSSSPIAEDPQ